MGLRDMLKKKDRLEEGYSADQTETVGRLAAPEFTFIRSDTHTEEVIYPPTTPIEENDTYLTARDSDRDRARPHSKFGFKSRTRGSSVGSSPSDRDSRDSKEKKEVRRSRPRALSQRLHLSPKPKTSEFVPQNLPKINLPVDGTADKEGAESQWEKRATILAKANEDTRSRSQSPDASEADQTLLEKNAVPKKTDGVVSSKQIDEQIQEAIRLHEEGSLEQSTKLFGHLADPHGANNPLSQVLYGLALRHGWGCEPEPERAVTFLSAAASNAAAVENMALQAGLKKGGAAKGELVLAIFELANCFRHGWGIGKDPIAAKQYYETAANLGDTDAMNEVAWCYLNGFGGKKDKFAAAKYYRLAEENGNKTLGNTWIWKDKYNPPTAADGDSKKKK